MKYLLLLFCFSLKAQTAYWQPSVGAAGYEVAYKTNIDWNYVLVGTNTQFTLPTPYNDYFRIAVCATNNEATSDWFFPPFIRLSWNGTQLINISNSTTIISNYIWLASIMNSNYTFQVYDDDSCMFYSAGIYLTIQAKNR